MKQFAVDLGLDAATFNECLDSGKYTELVTNDTELARQIGATSTPAFIINGQPLVGAQPFDVFQQIFEGILTE